MVWSLLSKGNLTSSFMISVSCGPSQALLPVSSCCLSVVSPSAVLTQTHIYSMSPSTGDVPVALSVLHPMPLQYILMLHMQVGTVSVSFVEQVLFSIIPLWTCLGPGFYRQLDSPHVSVTKIADESKLGGGLWLIR